MEVIARPRPQRKKISLFSITAICVTSMIGSGWMFAPLLAAQIAGNYSFIAWFLAMLAMLIMAFSYVPLIRAYPVNGISSRCVSLSHGPILGLPFAFANWISVLVATPTEAQGSGQYLVSMMSHGENWSEDRIFIYGKIIATVILIMYLAINYYGIRLMARLNNPITILKVATPIFLAIALMASHFDTSNFTLATNSAYHSDSIIHAIVGAGMIYCLAGFQVSINFVNEVENPNRNIPLSLFISIISVGLLFIFVQMAFMGSVPSHLLSQGWAQLNFKSPLLQVTLLLGMHFFSMVLLADSFVSPASAGYTCLGASASMIYGMVQEKQLPRALASDLHPRYNISRRAMVISFALSLSCLWLLKDWGVLMSVVSFLLVVGFMGGPITLGVIKRSYRWFGFLVFILIGLLLHSLPRDTILMGNVAFCILLGIYSVLHLSKGMTITSFLIPLAPFVIYMWLLYFVQNNWMLVMLAAVVYFIFTCVKFLNFCKSCPRMA
jgi:amino acid transporter